MKKTMIWSTLSHENIMPLEGLVIVNAFPGLMLEWEENGTVHDYVAKNAGCDYVKLVSCSRMPLILMLSDLTY